MRTIFNIYAAFLDHPQYPQAIWQPLSVATSKPLGGYSGVTAGKQNCNRGNKMATRKISVSRCKVRGKSMWRVRRWINGKPNRSFFATKQAATAAAAKFRAEDSAAGNAWLQLPPADRDNLIIAYNDAKANGVNIHRAILEARHVPGLASKPIDDVVKELQLSRLACGANRAYVKNLAIVLNQFMNGREKMQIGKFTLTDVEEFLNSKNLCYRSTLRGRLSTLFNFAVRRGYRQDNPCDRLESVKVAQQPPHIFTIDQVKTAVNWLIENAPHGLAWFALSTACGLRPDEAAKTDAKRDIDFKEGFIRVEAQVTKVRQRRVVYPNAEAMKFLKWAIAKGGILPLTLEVRRKFIAGRKRKAPGLRDALGFKVWPKDITRHTAASYWLACKGTTVSHVAKMLGHSEYICESRYKALVTQKKASEFWKMIAGY